MRIVEIVVDALPIRLWRSGNLYGVPFGEWHFCVGRHPHSERPVRTVEWRGRQIAEGRREVNFDQFDYG